MGFAGIISSAGIITTGGFGDLVFLAQEAGDLILQESGDKIIV